MGKKLRFTIDVEALKEKPAQIQLNVRLPKELYKRLEEVCRVEGLSVSSAVRQMISAFVEQMKV